MMMMILFWRHFCLFFHSFINMILAIYPSFMCSFVIYLLDTRDCFLILSLFLIFVFPWLVSFILFLTAQGGVRVSSFQEFWLYSGIFCI
jgi:hypothetical protein